MKILLKISKLFIIGACFFIAQPSHGMMQNLLDHIQKYGKPATQKTTDFILLRPRMLTSIMSESFQEHIATGILMGSLLGSMEMASPGLITYLRGARNVVLLKAIKSGNIPLIRSLITHGHDINANRSSASPSLVWAARYNKPNVINFLLEADADIDVIDYSAGITPLMAAAIYGSLDAVKTLLAAGADATIKGRDNNKTALDFAVIDRAWNNPEMQKNKLEIQRLLRFQMAKHELKPHIESLLERKEAARLAREDIEEHAKSAGSQAGAQDISEIIKGYL